MATRASAKSQSKKHSAKTSTSSKKRQHIKGEDDDDDYHDDEEEDEEDDESSSTEDEASNSKHDPNWRDPNEPEENDCDCEDCIVDEGGGEGVPPLEGNLQPIVTMETSSDHSHSQDVSYNAGHYGHQQDSMNQGYHQNMDYHTQQPNPYAVPQPQTSSASTYEPVKPLNPPLQSRVSSGLTTMVCPEDGCGKKFGHMSRYKRHLNYHYKIKPYQCRWPGCSYSSAEVCNVVSHVRIRHFRLPKSKEKQRELAIVDDRDPKQYVETVKELL